MLSHAVEIDADGEPVRVLCHRVRLDSLADHFAQDTTQAPTCPYCAVWWRAHPERHPRG